MDWLLILFIFRIFIIPSLYDVYRNKNTIASFLFNIVVQYNTDTVDF